MKIVVVMEDTSRSGGIRTLVEMANRLTERGHDCNVVLPRNTQSIPFETHIPVMEVGFPLPNIPNLRNLAHMATLDQFLPSAELYVACSWRSAFPVWRSARQRGIPAVWYVQADERLLLPDGNIGRIKRSLVERAYSLPIHWVINSKWLRERLGDEFNHQAHIAHPGVDLNIFQPGPQQRTNCTGSDSFRVGEKFSTIVSIGRSIPIKGLQDLISALNIVATSHKIQLVLITPENISISTNFPVKIIRPASDAELAEWYRQSNLFVYSSWFEGFGLPPLEAMACGVPVVTTDCGGIREYAIDGYNALLTPIRNPTALANAIQRLLSDANLRDNLIQNGLETARRFTWEVFTDQVENIFLGLMNQSK